MQVRVALLPTDAVGQMPWNPKDTVARQGDLRGKLQYSDEEFLKRPVPVRSSHRDQTEGASALCATSFRYLDDTQPATCDHKLTKLSLRVVLRTGGIAHRDAVQAQRSISMPQSDKTLYQIVDVADITRKSSDQADLCS